MRDILGGMDLQLFSQEKTEPASPRRRQRAKEQGQVSQSQDLLSAASFLASVIALRFTLTPAAKGIALMAVRIWSRALPSEPTVSWAMEALRDAFGCAALASLPVMAGALLLGSGASILQTGLMIRPNLLTPDFGRLNPVSGFTRLFSRKSLVQCLKSLVKIALVSLLVWNCLRDAIPDIGGLSVEDPVASLSLTRSVVERLLLTSGVFLLLVGVLDYGWQWWEHERSLRMTQRELRDEMREAEVKPELRQAMRARQRQLGRRRMMHEVPSADVVVTNPTHYSVALAYDGEKDEAPRVVAKGMDLIALRIREIALEEGIPIVPDPPLARSLYKAADVGDSIPPDLFKAVAEVLAYVYRQKGRVPGEGEVS